VHHAVVKVLQLQEQDRKGRGAEERVDRMGRGTVFVADRR
jgi:hypothetical protein